ATTRAGCRLAGEATAASRRESRASATPLSPDRGFTARRYPCWYDNLRRGVVEADRRCLMGVEVVEGGSHGSAASAPTRRSFVGHAQRRPYAARSRVPGAHSRR